MVQILKYFKKILSTYLMESFENGYFFFTQGYNVTFSLKIIDFYYMSNEIIPRV